MKKEPTHLDYKELLEEAGLQQIQEQVSKVTGLAALVTDPSGKPITRISNLCPFCAIINNTDPGHARCMGSRIETAKAVAKSGQPALQLCHAGLVLIALPIKIKNETVAVVIGENVSLEPLRLEIVPELARELSLNGKELMEAARRVPVWTEERLREAVEPFHTFTDTLSRLLYSKQELQEKTEKLAALFEFSQVVTSSLRISEVAKQALELVFGLTGATSGSVVMLAGETSESIEVAATAESSKEFRVVPEKEVIEAVTREGSELRFDSHPEGNTVEEKRPALSMPLKVGDKITGVLTLSGKLEGAEFGEDEARFLSVLGTSLALALENARLFRDLEENAAMLKQLIEVGQLVSSSLEADVIMGYVLQSLKEVLGAKWCVLRLLDEETGELVLKASLGMSKDLQAEVERVRAEGTILGEVLKTAQPQLVEDLAKCAPSLHLPYYSKEIRSVAVVPVLARGKVLGTLKVYSSSPRRWKEEEVGYLATIASQTGLALENARLYSSLRDYYLSAVQALAAALEAKDVYTRGHSVRVANWARACARVLGLGAEEQEQVYLAGLLHDLGKIGVREDILLKPGPLTEEERKEMQSHPVVGARILEPARFPAAVITAVRHHHEDYGGGGYPAGLVGEEIPLLARIIRVADTYDAMTSARPYRQALTQRQAREELRRWAGRQFDPRVVEAFLQIPEDQMEEIPGGRGGYPNGTFCRSALADNSSPWKFSNSKV
ncbi:HD domain-containing phosphohydrolase [Desulforamulus putei]|uniref:HDIG domain-containing protein n=1 Tax=Desulforamulus putei DSM 12395 TaxID=1121429 RepID=A0A1M5A0N7_9FIRM|nr:HD domain-containing phosphohydrolase [Desulforamulus putei]SHF23835.1 HDIG domain-containing protein [Desulforamulus putei DSM 12395]